MSAPAPSPMPTPDLGGLLRRPTAQPVPAPAAGPAVTDHRATDAPAKTSARSRKQTSPPAADTPAQSTAGASKVAARSEGKRQYLRSIAVYLPRSLHQQLRVAAARQNTTATALILAAVNSTHDRVAEALAREAGQKAADGDLFEIPQARRVVEPTVQTTIRVTDSQYGALSDLAAKHEVNRSQLLAVAVRLHLT